MFICITFCFICFFVYLSSVFLVFYLSVCIPMSVVLPVLLCLYLYRCDSRCEQCYGPSNSECLVCKQYKVYMRGSDDLKKVTVWVAGSGW